MEEYLRSEIERQRNLRFDDSGTDEKLERLEMKAAANELERIDRALKPRKLPADNYEQDTL